MLSVQQENILQQAWNLYAHNLYTNTLGMCIMTVHAPLRAPEHSILSKLNGYPAIQYFEEHYVSK